eukprot:GHVU01003697.1.p1 GENE.GHVU01003697.1~~GHVU01003697.1.p1  ORF type:complete len:462 (-),score=33.87 GHVU01003697.1:293-1594(-)
MLSAFDGRGCCPRILGVDEVAATPNLDVCLRTNTITGVCYEHRGLLNLEFSSAVVFDDVLAEVKRCTPETAHLAKEALVMCVTGLDRVETAATPVCALGTCKKGTPCQGMSAIRRCLEVWRETCADQYGPVWAVATDGDPKRRQGAHIDLRVGPRHGDFACVLAPLRGLDLLASEFNEISVPDPRHLFKRCRNAIIGEDKRIYIGEVAVTGTHIRHLLEANDVPNVRTLMDPTDKMNVPAATELLKGIRDADLEKVPTRHHHNVFAKHVKVLQVLCGALLAPFDVDLDLSQQLISASTLAHLVGFLYDIRPSQFIPGVLYHDLQAWVKAMYVFTARMKVWARDSTLMLNQAGTDQVESLFRQTRTRDHSTTYSTLHLETQLTIASQIDALLHQHPEWKGRDRRSIPSIDTLRARHCTGNYRCNEVRCNLPFSM